MQRFLSFLTEKGIIPNLGVIRATGETRKHDRDIDPYLPGGARYTGEPTHTMAFDHKEIPAGTKVSIVKKEDINNVTHVHVKPEGTNKVTVVRVDKIHKPIGGRVGKNPEEKEDTAISGLDSQIKKAVEFHGRAITIHNNDGSTYQATGARKVASGDYKGKKPKADVLIHNESEPVDFKSHKSSAKPSEQQNYEGLSAHTDHPQANSFINDLTKHTHGKMTSGVSHGRELNTSTPQGKNLQKSVMFGNEHGSKKRSVNNVSSIEHGEMKLVPHPSGIPGHYIIQSEKSIHNDKSFKPENHPLKFIARYASERNDHGIKGARVGIGPASSRKTTELPK